MQSVGIESSGFRSRRLTRQMADEADLILCFEKQQRKEIVTLAPAAVRYTFLLDDFANMCDYCARNNMIAGLTIQERLQSVIKKSSMIRPMIPQPKDIADPHGREFSMFCVAAEQTNGAIRKILKSMRKHRTVTPAPIRSQIVA
jgi:protein-tyrosine phosphatase